MGKTTGTPRIALTAGDPFGIGPEVALAAVADLGAEVTFYGPPEVLPGIDRIVTVPLEGDAPSPAGPSAAGGRASLLALECALDDLRSGAQDALVTGPISKESWALAGGPPDGHTPLLGRFFGVSEPLMAFAIDDDEPVVGLLTTHIPLRAVPSSLTSARVERTALVLLGALAGPFGRPAPKLAILGLNPHAGEDGLLGTEENDFLDPAIERLRARGHAVEGPLPADAAFAVRKRFDGILALYHDQGLGPVKALAFDRAVNITLGLPAIRTSPCHGTAFDLAGTGRADPSSMRAALEWAVRLAR
jgi:4-hydroxythreonine-4-phosphate dehydrogenase